MLAATNLGVRDQNGQAVVICLGVFLAIETNAYYRVKIVEDEKKWEMLSDYRQRPHSYFITVNSPLFPFFSRSC